MSANPSKSSPLDEPLPYRLRSDLVAVKQMTGAGVRWAVKDPVALQYFHFQEREWSLLQTLDGRRSFQEVKAILDRQYAPFALIAQDFLQFIQRVYLDGLLLVERHGQGRAIMGRSLRQQQRQRLGRLFSFLAIRFRGIDPHRILDFLSPIGSILFHPLTAVLALIFGIATLTGGLLYADVVAERMPSAGWFIKGENLIWMMVALSLVKILHELGHGLACRHFGGECHEMGLMLLAFTPCLYCNVSDAWMFESRGRRIIVSAAGIYVELMLACLCLIGWYFTHPGILNSILLSVVFICSVNTAFLNGNPLLRYDGYYIATDLFDIPNLAAKSKAALWNPMVAWLKGQPVGGYSGEPIRWRLATYAVASAVYRVFVISTIAWFIYQTAKAYEVVAIGQILIALIFVGMLLPALVNLLKFVRQPRRLGMFRWTRLGVVGMALFAALYALLNIPLPKQVNAPVAVEAADATYIYAPINGRIEQASRLGTVVSPNELICTLHNEDLDAKLDQIEQTIAEHQVRLAGLRTQLSFDHSLASRIEEAEAEIAELELRQQSILDERSRGLVRSAIAGRLIKGEYPKSTDDPGRSLPRYDGSPLEQQNADCFVQRGELLCIVGATDKQQIVAYVKQTDIEFVLPGNKVRVRLDQQPDRILDGEVVEVAKEEVKSIPTILRDAEDHQARPDEVYGSRPLETTYRVTITTKSDLPEMIYGSGGRARIVADHSTLGQRLTRYLLRTIRVEL